MLPLIRVSDGQQAQRIIQFILDFFIDRRNFLEVAYSPLVLYLTYIY